MEETQQLPLSKPHYEAVQIEVIRLSCTDIITTSGSGDKNQGEWDPQESNMLL